LRDVKDSTLSRQSAQAIFLNNFKSRSYYQPTISGSKLPSVICNVPNAWATVQNSFQNFEQERVNYVSNDLTS
jgi:hypothetical protein